MGKALGCFLMIVPCGAMNSVTVSGKVELK
jgi:hypothetical protein